LAALLGADFGDDAFFALVAIALFLLAMRRSCRFGARRI
jgi:hypothetical protein